jgi:hypothetical protein
MKKSIAFVVLGLSLFGVGYFLSDQGLHAPIASELKELETLCQNSQQATAILDSNYSMRSTKVSKNTYPTNSFTFSYHYNDSGINYDGTMTLDSVPVGKTIQVWYSPENPKLHARQEPCASLAVQQPSAVPAWYLYLGIPLAMTGFFIVYRHARRLLGRNRGTA